MSLSHHCLELATRMFSGLRSRWITPGSQAGELGNLITNIFSTSRFSGWCEPTPTLLRPFARHLVGKMVIHCSFAHLLITKRSPVLVKNWQVAYNRIYLPNWPVVPLRYQVYIALWEVICCRQEKSMDHDIVTFKSCIKITNRQCYSTCNEV